MIINGKKILIIEPHSDDSIIAGGGFLKKHSENNELIFALISASSLNLVHGFVSRAERISEYENYASYYNGIVYKQKDLTDVYQLPVDSESNLDQVSKSKLVKTIENIILDVKPNVILFMGPSFHHDHTIVYECCIAATRPTFTYSPELILIMENPTYVHDPYPPGFLPNFYCELSIKQIEYKCASFSNLFPSQIRSSGNYLSVQGLTRWAAYRGIEARAEYAEAFSIKFLRL